jgi:hypothetical protein
VFIVIENNLENKEENNSPLGRVRRNSLDQAAQIFAYCLELDYGDLLRSQFVPERINPVVHLVVNALYDLTPFVENTRLLVENAPLRKVGNLAIMTGTVIPFA